MTIKNHKNYCYLVIVVYKKKKVERVSSVWYNIIVYFRNTSENHEIFGNTIVDFRDFFFQIQINKVD